MIENLENEIWKDIKGYEGYYMVSNKGRVKSVERKELSNIGKTYFERRRNEMIISLNETGNGYLNVELWKNDKSIKTGVHRFVYEAFVGDIIEGLIIHHINEIKKDNRPENLKQIDFFEHNNFHSHIPWNKNLSTKTNEKWAKTIVKATIERNKTFLLKAKKSYDLFKIQNKSIEEIIKIQNLTKNTILKRIKKYEKYLVATSSTI
jgi:hypothetical protein